MRVGAIVSIFLILLNIISSAVNAEHVKIRLRDNLELIAEHQRGDDDKPLLVLVHGFLQTNEFSTVRRLTDAMAENGYSVLAPNLSLGISNRSRSLQCESIHLHSLTESASEIARWIHWGRSKYQEIILIGHSAGSVIITAYLAQGADPSVSKTILISLDSFGPDRPAAFETGEHAELARQMVKEDKNDLADFALSYCKKYVTTPANFLSYYDWSGEKVIDAIQNSSPENYVIIGSADQRIRKSWIDMLLNAGVRLKIVDGASHFFDQAHEFDLLDAVEGILAAE